MSYLRGLIDSVIRNLVCLVAFVCVAMFCKTTQLGGVWHFPRKYIRVYLGREGIDYKAGFWSNTRRHTIEGALSGCGASLFSLPVGFYHLL